MSCGSRRIELEIVFLANVSLWEEPIPTYRIKGGATSGEAEIVDKLPLKLGFVARLWYYFRLGYSTYLTFLLGFISTLITVYYLAIKNIPELLNIFPKFVPFAILSTLIGAPLSIIIGWLHLKRSAAFSAEVDIGAESNPYMYKLYPGYMKDVQYPVYLELLSQMKRLLDAQHALTPEDSARIDNLEEKVRTLVSGGFVGSPRRYDMRKEMQ